MIRIGEKLNSSLPGTREAIERRDEGAIAALARAQLDAGADWLDVNAAALLSGETEVLIWMMDIVQRETGAKIMIDSPNPGAVAAALAADRAGEAIINSVTLEEARLVALLPLALRHGTGIVALPISPEGLPKTPEARLQNANELVARLIGAGVAPGRIYVDALVGALSADPAAASVALETIRLLRAAHPAVNILCGVSNISFGLPERRILNAAFLTGAILAGANAAILDVAEPMNGQAIAAAEALAGRDEYCQNYLKFCRQGKDSQL